MSVCDKKWRLLTSDLALDYATAQKRLRQMDKPEVTGQVLDLGRQNINESWGCLAKFGTPRARNRQSWHTID